MKINIKTQEEKFITMKDIKQGDAIISMPDGNICICFYQRQKKKLFCLEDLCVIDDARNMRFVRCELELDVLVRGDLHNYLVQKCGRL